MKYSKEINNYYNPTTTRINNLFALYRSPQYRQAINQANRPEFPFVSAIELTNYCQLRCLFCARQVMTRPKGYIDPKLFYKILDEYRQHGTFVKISGWGENIIHPCIDAFITAIKKENGLYFVSNCQSLEINTIEIMIENKMDVLQISFQGTNKEDYEAQRKGSSYNKLKQHIKELIKRRGDAAYPFIHMSTTILDESDKQIEDFISMCFDMGIDSVGIGRTEYDRFSIYQIEKSAIRAEIKKYKARQTLAKIPNHSYLFQSLDVCWDGIAVTCFFDYDQFIPVGDLKKNSLYAIWNHSEVLHALRILEEKKLLNEMKFFDSFHYAWRGGAGAYNMGNAK
jgi:MoaA/NifB/PqqE/SkfB family radical SAM enzyme